MPEPEPQSFRVAIGQAKTLVVTMDSAPGGGVAGWVMEFTLRRRGAAVPLLTKTTGAGVTCTDAVNGVWEVAIAAGDTEDLKPGLPDWSLWRVDDGSESPVAYGTCTVYRTALTG